MARWATLQNPLTAAEIEALPRRCPRIFPQMNGMYRACRRREGHAGTHAWDPAQHDNTWRRR